MSDEQKPVVATPAAPVVKIEEPKFDPQKYEVRVKGMSHRQLVAELDGIAERKYNGKEFVMNPPKGLPLETRTGAGLDNALAVVLLTVLKNTMTANVFEFKKDGITPKRVARRDQFGPGTMSHYLR